MISEQSGKEFVSFGQYNMDRDTVFVRSDSPYQNMADLKGQRISTAGTGASLLLEAAMFKKMEGVDLRLGGGDYKLTVQEFIAMPATLEKGDFEASMGAVDFEIPYLRTGKHRWLFPETPVAWEYYRVYIDPTQTHNGCMSNLWVTTPEWLDTNLKVAEGFNVMWQEGVNAWFANKETIVAAYPDLFPTTNQADIDWFLKYLETWDQCVKTVYMDPTWVEAEKAVFTLLKEQGFVKESTPDPVFKIMASPRRRPARGAAAGPGLGFVTIAEPQRVTGSMRQDQRQRS